MRRALIIALIITNCVLMAGALYLLPAIYEMADAILLQASLTQQAHERIDVLERALRINTTPGPSRGSTRLVKVTAYTADDWPDNPAYGITASGYQLTNADAWRVAAADPEYYPAWTKIHVAGVGVMTILDTGGAVRGPDHIDIFAGMTAVSEAREWGVRQVPVRVLGRAEP